jgi:ferredoxin
MNEDDLAFVHDPNGAPEDAIQQEIDTCPTECIIWLEV